MDELIVRHECDDNKKINYKRETQKNKWIMKE